MGFSPFYLLYGREPRLPMDFCLGSSADALVSPDRAGLAHDVRLVEDLRNARELVLSRMDRVHRASKQRFDERRLDKSFSEGDRVLLYKPFRKLGTVEKLLHRWLGPYVVESVLSDVNNEVRLASGLKRKSEIVHVEKLKKFHVLEDELSPTDQPEPILVPRKRGRPHKDLSDSRSLQAIWLLLPRSPSHRRT